MRAIATPPPSIFRTGMLSLRALSARFFWMPVPGKTGTPIGRASSIASFYGDLGTILNWVERVPERSAKNVDTPGAGRMGVSVSLVAGVGFGFDRNEGIFRCR
jgi:hypothetical protein